MLVEILKKMFSKMTPYFPFFFLQRNTYLGSEKDSLPQTTFLLIKRKKKKANFRIYMIQMCSNINTIGY